MHKRHKLAAEYSKTNNSRLRSHATKLTILSEIKPACLRPSTNCLYNLHLPYASSDSERFERDVGNCSTIDLLIVRFACAALPRFLGHCLMALYRVSQ